MAAYSRWALIRGWALIWINTVHRSSCIQLFWEKKLLECSCDNPERYYEWFCIHSSSSRKFEGMAREAIDVSLRVLKESSKSRFDSYMYSVSVFVIPVLLRLQLQSSTLYLHLHIYSHSSYLLHIYYTIIAIVHNLTDNRKYTIFDQKVFNTLHYKFLHVWCHCYNIFSNYLFLSSTNQVTSYNAIGQSL